MTWPLFSETSTYMLADLVLFSQTCLLVHWKSKRKATWLMPLHQTCQITLWNFICQDCYIVNTTYMPCRELLCCCSCNMYACWPSVTVTNTAVVRTCLLVECCCKQDACWTVPLNQHACWPFVTQNCMSPGVVLLYLLYLLVWCLTISRVFWYGVSLSSVPAGVVNHYRSCLLVWYIYIRHACWCGASL